MRKKNLYKEKKKTIQRKNIYIYINCNLKGRRKKLKIENLNERQHQQK